MLKTKFALTSLLVIIGTAAGAVGTMQDTSLGKVIANDDGLTLYTFDKDADGKSACYGDCATNWPPFIAGADAKAEGDFGLTERDDGTMQWTYEGKPLYLWVGDSAPGDVTGDGVNGVWHVAK